VLSTEVFHSLGLFFGLGVNKVIKK